MPRRRHELAGKTTSEPNRAFSVGKDAKLLDESTKVISAFLEGGGRMIDSSPMYGSAQMAETQRRWGVDQIDLMQVHNLVNWEGHLRTLAEMKADGRIRAIGITTSHGSRHEALEKIMSSHEIDFVQLTYNVVDRDVEQRLLPLAQEKQIAVIVNRPYQRGALLRRFEKQRLPNWVAETGAKSWAQFLLKFVVSHPAVTCAIPATTRVDHVRENLAVATGTMPDAALRRRMADYIRQL